MTLPSSLPIGERWFDFKRIDDDITLICEPHVDPLIRCNIWHVRGADHDILVDSGLGIMSLKDAAHTLFEKRLMAVATHTHYDHTGGFAEFDELVVHTLEAAELDNPVGFCGLRACDFRPDDLACIRNSGYDMPDALLTALPRAAYDLQSYRVLPAPATRTVDEGAIIDLGNRRFEVLHLPGHSPGSIGLWEAASGILFSGDAVYDGPLLDMLPGSDIEQYVATMKRLRDLPVNVVHAGHDPSFGRARLRELAEGYLALRA